MENRNLGSIFRYLRNFYGQEKEDALKRRIAQRRLSNAKGLYKVLNRDRFYARRYSGHKNKMSLIDISTTGCAFMTHYYIPKGTYLEVELEKLASNHAFSPSMMAACETVYCRSTGESSNRIGVKFLSIDWKDVEKIRLFTEQQQKH